VLAGHIGLAAGVVTDQDSASFATRLVRSSRMALAVALPSRMVAVIARSFCLMAAVIP
jgi:hypothetical protein